MSHDEHDEHDEHHDEHHDDAAFHGITLTPEAQAAAREMRAGTPEWSALALRVYIDGKGCDGFYYGVSFDPPTAQDQTFACGDLTIVVDPDSYRFIAGSHVIWVDDERGKGFLVENPRHRQFRGKFYKRPAWQDEMARRQATSRDA